MFSEDNCYSLTGKRRVDHAATTALPRESREPTIHRAAALLSTSQVPEYIPGLTVDNIFGHLRGALKNIHMLFPLLALSPKLRGGLIQALTERHKYRGATKSA